MSIRNQLPARLNGHGLPAEYYRSPCVYDREVQAIWQSAWLFCGMGCEIPHLGDFFTVNVGEAPILVIRNERGIQAFHNVCPHRGTILCDEPSGRAGKLIVCPYHQWSFSQSGELQACRGMQAVDRSALGLQKVPILEVAGMLFVNLSNDPPDSSTLQKLFASAAPHGFETAKVASAIDYRVAANWKIVWENNRECYHCDVGHPQYVRANFDSDEGDRETNESRATKSAILSRANAYWEVEKVSLKHVDGGLARFPDPDDRNPFPVSATRTVMVDGYETESMDGRRVAPLMGRIKSPEVGVLRLRSMPSFWCHASCDHAVLTRVLPGGRDATHIRVYWLVDRSSRENIDYSLDRLRPFWQLTSEQDWQICERVQRGVNSPAYRPGPLSQIREYNVDAFLEWYLARIS